MLFGLVNVARASFGGGLVGRGPYPCMMDFHVVLIKFSVDEGCL